MKLNSLKTESVLFAVSSVFLLICSLLFDIFIYSKNIHFSLSAIITVIITSALFFSLKSSHKINAFIKEKPWLCYLLLVITTILTSHLAVSNYLPSIVPVFFSVSSFLFAVYALKNKGNYGLYYSFLAAAPLLIMIFKVYSAMGLTICLSSVFVINLEACLLGWYGKANGSLIAKYVLICVFIITGLFLTVLSSNTYSFNHVANVLLNREADGLINAAFRDAVFNADMFIPIDKNSFCIDKSFRFYGLFNHCYMISFAGHNFGQIAIIIIVGMILMMITSGFMLSIKKHGYEKYISLAVINAMATYMTLYVAQNLGFAPFTIDNLNNSASIIIVTISNLIVLYHKRPNPEPSSNGTN